MMTPFQIYKIGQAIQVHFKTPEYDVFEKRGYLMGCTLESFQAKNNYVVLCNSLQRFLKEPKDAVQFFVANCAYNSNIFEINESLSSWKKWKKHKEMTTQLILDDLESIPSIEDYLSGDPCILQNKVSGGHINIETAVAINRVYKFSNSWKDNFVYSYLGLKIEKLDRFVSYNEEKILKAMNIELLNTQ